MVTHSGVLAWRIPMDRGAWQAAFLWAHKESDMTERRSASTSFQLLALPLLTTEGSIGII